MHPVDNMSAANAPSHPELLDELAEAIRKGGFDLKSYTRELVNSKTYQLASTGPASTTATLWFEQARTRPLTAEELLDSWKIALDFATSAKLSDRKPDADRYAPLGSGYLLQFFGSPSNGVGDFQGGLQEHLYLNNGGFDGLTTTSKGSLHASLISSESPWEVRVERLFLTFLSRPPAAEEKAKFTEFLTAEERPGDRLQEAIWTLMTCSEFRFNH